MNIPLAKQSNVAHCWLADLCQIQGFPHMIRNLGVKQIVSTGPLSALGARRYAIFILIFQNLGQCLMYTTHSICKHWS